MHIVLVNPEIPQNTGNIARTCAATGTTLHLIHPMGFSVDEKQVRRAGLDYWPLLDLHEHESLEKFFALIPPEKCTFLSTKASKCYTEVCYDADSVLVFGCETRGLPESLLAKHYEHCVRIPMLPRLRSLNLANSVAVVLYEALRQTGFAGMETRGALTDLQFSEK